MIQAILMTNCAKPKAGNRYLHRQLQGGSRPAGNPTLGKPIVYLTPG